MKESYGEGPASRLGLESCTDSRKAVREALTEVHVGQVSSREMDGNQSADVVHNSEGKTSGSVKASERWTPRAHRPCACMETSRARTGIPRQRPTRHSAWAGWRRPWAISPARTRAGSRTVVYYLRSTRTRTKNRPRRVWREEDRMPETEPGRCVEQAAPLRHS
jgi:hypothetical protein